MAQPLQGDCESEDAYQAFKSADGGPTNQWNKIRCSPRSSLSSQKCSCWCELLALCFVVDEGDKKKEWIRMCSSKFLQSSRFNNRVSRVNIEVVRCSPFTLSTERVFSIRASEGKRNCVVNKFQCTALNGRLALNYSFSCCPSLP